MILWCDGAHDAAGNMARDAALLDAAARGGPVVLRLFCFRPPGITLGRTQDPARALDLERCRRDGVPWAVRPTGGRAIFHAEEWTYALAAPLEDEAWGGAPQEAYARTSRLIVGSLRRLGIPAELVRTGARGADRTAGPAAPCFASSARHEVLLEGRKLVGSAQRRTARGLLQQGSVLLGEGHLRLADYLPLPPEARARTREALRRSAACGGGWLPGGCGLERWAEAIQAELGPGARRLDGAAGAFLLTGAEAPSYTAPFA